jgi:hypothetical protein
MNGLKLLQIIFIIVWCAGWGIWFLLDAFRQGESDGVKRND